MRVIALRHVQAALTYPRVYVRNLEERIKVDQLKEALNELFGEYGEIVDIVAKTNLKAKGQAFIVFDSVESAQKAIDEVQGFELFEKPMQLAFAKTRSDASVKRSGDEDEFESHKRRRLAEKGMLHCTFVCPFPNEMTLLTPTHLHRQEESRRSSRATKASQACCSRRSTPRRRRSARQSIAWCWSQIYECWRSCCHPRRVPPTQQDSLRTEPARGVRYRCINCYIW